MFLLQKSRCVLSDFGGAGPGMVPGVGSATTTAKMTGTDLPGNAMKAQEFMDNHKHIAASVTLALQHGGACTDLAMHLRQTLGI